MGAYAYKYCRDMIPPYVTEAIEDYESDPNYDGDMWDAATTYIQALEAELKKQIKASGIVFDTELVDWLKNRPETSYANKGWDV